MSLAADSVDRRIINNQDVGTQILLAFSWKQNYKKMSDTHRQYSIDIQEICVVKVLCALVIIFVHTCTFLHHVSSECFWGITLHFSEI